jgi:hypothetical protein
MKSVYGAVRTGSLNKTVLPHKLIDFYNQMKSSYSAVRTGSSNNVGLYNRDEKCLQRGTDCGFK